MQSSFGKVAGKSEYRIGFTGLSDGHHSFTFQIGKSFFDPLDYSEIRDGDLQVKLDLEKKAAMMIASFDISGKVNVMCDRCTEYFDLPVSGKSNLIYKFSDENLDDENVQTIYPNETEIDVSHPLYEFISTMLPVRRLHPEGECDVEMLKSIDQYLMVEEQKTSISQSDQINDEEQIEPDPRWAALRKLKDKK